MKDAENKEEAAAPTMTFKKKKEKTKKKKDKVRPLFSTRERGEFVLN
jgi:hypothetical protein